MHSRAAQIPAWAPRLDAASLRRQARIRNGVVCAAAAALFLALAPLGAWLPDPAASLPQPTRPRPARVEAPSVPAVVEPAGLAVVADLSQPLYEPATAGEIARAELPGSPAGVVVVPPEGEAAMDEAAEPDLLSGETATLRVITGRVDKGGTISQAMQAQGVEPLVIHELSVALRPIFDFRRAHAGDFFALVQDSSGRTLSFEFQRGRRDIYRLERNFDDALVPSFAEVPLERRVIQLAGIVQNSLFEAILDLGENGDLAAEFASIFIWDFDFAKETRPGDEFRMVVEKFYDRDGFVRYGTVLAGQYRTSQRDFTAVYFEDDDGYGDYYSPDGSSLRRAFLRAPLRYRRISSRYSNSRLHPILKVRRPHHGIDYAAPLGTRVWAVADGEVVFKGWSGGFGRLLKIRHNNGYVSYYGHLSRYEDGLAVGTRVRQKDVIGYVGSSGLSSGPHLDYRLNIAGRFVDPMKVKLPQGTPIPVQARDRFEEIKGSRLRELSAASPPLVLEAAM